MSAVKGGSGSPRAFPVPLAWTIAIAFWAAMVRSTFLAAGIVVVPDCEARRTQGSVPLVMVMRNPPPPTRGELVQPPPAFRLTNNPAVEVGATLNAWR
jgi:hypothetical protein